MTTTDFMAKFKTHGIGGSEIAALLGLDPYSSPYKVWALKTGREPKPVYNNYMKAGNYLEDAVAQYFAKDTGFKVEIMGLKEPLVHPKYEFAIGFPDRKYFNPADGSRGTLEIKTVQGEIDIVPNKWLCQLQWYMGLEGVETGALAWLEHGLNFRHLKDIPFDAELMDLMLETAERFWVDNCLKDIPPAAIKIEDVLMRWKKHFPGKVLDADAELNGLHKEMLILRSSLKEQQMVYDQMADMVRTLMEDAEAVKIPGKDKYLFTWKANKDGETFDKDTFEKENPELYAKYKVFKPGARVFLIKDLK